jgi:hypothetical protein
VISVSIILLSNENGGEKRKIIKRKIAALYKIRKHYCVQWFTTLNIPK